MIGDWAGSVVDHGSRALPRVAAAREARHGRAPEEAVIDARYEVFVPKNAGAAAGLSPLIGGVGAVVASLRAEGLRTRSTLGDTRAIVAEILAPDGRR